MKLAYWVRMLGLVTFLFALVGMGLLLVNSEAAQTLAVALVIFASRIALIVAALGVVVSWQRRRWRWVAALALAGMVTLLSGPLSALMNSSAPFLVGPLVVGALGLAATGLPRLPRLPRATGASAR